ncbi:LANO_0C08262g1_1 [Lachancea nothofagi CBS 11611]|uniref:LANO_0C08262g1_1 n=1 Tax=Lachancea nothofagi CBS 11611 TaxID=1266666 RepID=A0A1G4J9G3_9SACH|nr:LANO_0C08262g1_1 [Lachancea nothofagi CBS 11611]
MKGRANELMRPTFWSEDYITGINLLYNNIKNDIAELQKNVAIIRGFDVRVVSPAFHSLEYLMGSNLSDKEDLSLCANIQRQQAKVLGELLKKLEIVDHSELELNCQVPLEALIYEYEEFHQESHQLLSQNYESYKKHLSLAKQVRADLTSRAAQIRQALSHTLPSREEKDAEKSTATLAETSSLLLISYPFIMDKKLTFKQESELLDFCDRLKKATKTSRSLIPIPGMTNVYFSGSQLFDGLKKLEPRMDISLFNLERVGQILLTAKIIWPYQNMMGSQPRFTAAKYYSWGTIEQYTGALSNQPPPRTGAVFNDFFKRMSSKSNDCEVIATLEDLEEKRHEFKECDNRLFQECQNLDYWRTQLELELQKAMNHYWRLIHRKTRCLDQVTGKFFALLQDSFSLTSKREPVDELCEIKRVYGANHSTVGYYMPQPGLTYARYSLDGEMVGPAIFHTELQSMPTDETGFVIVLVFLKTYLEKYNADQVLHAWALPLDLKRASRLRRDCVAEFQSAEGDHLTALTHFIASKSPGLNDVVALLQDWLLELPDSVIPMACYEGIKEKGVDGLRRSPGEHLLNLALLCEHFKWLVHHCGAESISELFHSRTDFPLSQVFARSRVQEPQDVEKMSHTVHDIMCQEGNSEFFLKLAATEKEPAIARLSVQEPPQFSDAAFVPRPLKTASTGPSPVPSRPNSKRISGIDLLGRESEKQISPSTKS